MKTKPITLSNGLILVQVPKDAVNINLYNKNTLRYQVGLIPTYENISDMDWNYELLGTITKNVSSFDPELTETIKDKIEAETDLLFENNHEPKHSFTWEYQQPRVIEKLVVLKELK